MLDFNVFTGNEHLENIISFNYEDISAVLSYIGILDETKACKEESMSKLVFLHGNENEVYSMEERTFIESIDTVLIFPEFHKRIRRGFIPCRIVATEIDDPDEEFSAAFFMKEIIKAIDGFTLFFIKIYNLYYLGMKKYSEDSCDDFSLSKPFKTVKELELISCAMYYVKDDDFINYYESWLVAIEQINDDINYDRDISRFSSLPGHYLETFWYLENNYNGFMRQEKTYDSLLEEYVRVEYDVHIKDIQKQLSFIKSSKINTMEMLFEAEELEQIARDNEEKNDLIIANSANSINSGLDDNSDIKSYLGDPEKMIKILKKRKGI